MLESGSEEGSFDQIVCHDHFRPFWSSTSRFLLLCQYSNFSEFIRTRLTSQLHFSNVFGFNYVMIKKGGYAFQQYGGHSLYIFMTACLETKELLDFQGRCGTASIARWNLRRAMLGRTFLGLVRPTLGSARLWLPKLILEQSATLSSTITILREGWG